MKLITVVGARPQFIKAAVVSRAITNFNSKLRHGMQPIKEIIIHTGQHYDKNMSEVFFDQMSIPKPKYNLGVQGGLHGAMTGRMLEKIEKVIVDEKPDMILVYGDTNSTLAGALVASKLNIPVAHIEAGLRSYKSDMPEEINRILTDHVSKILFCPTVNAVENLEKEGIGKTNNRNIIHSGDVMFDAVLFYREVANPTIPIEQLVNNLKGKYYLATVHRANNTDNQEHLYNIIEAFETISKQIPVIFPIHPRTQKMLEKNQIRLKNTKVIQAVSYFDMLYLLNNCSAVFTDSGGLQKEAYFCEKPCIILRDETEWIELVDNGFSILAGNDSKKILEAEKNLSILNKNYSIKMYGQGNAGTNIVELIYNTYLSTKCY